MNAERVEKLVAALDRGEIRVAERAGGEWVVNEEAKQAILDYFRLRRVEPVEVGPFEYLDKIPLKRDYASLGVRVVPPAVARYGSFLSEGVVMMPCYVNIGAWVGPLRFAGVALILTGVVFALATIVRALRFQADRITEIAAERQS